MRILYCKCFGIGNAVMAVPALKALKSMGHQVDVLVGTLPDDGGAYEVMCRLRDHMGTIGTVYKDNALPGRYDIAILAIPFDGRWRNGTHFIADKVMDGRTRPDPSTTGLISWKKHEVEYQMDNVRELGYEGHPPDTSFFIRHATPRDNRIYLGIGYKKDAAGFWKQKHWGNENYAELVKRILAENPRNVVVTSGDAQDLVLTIAPIARMVNDKRFIHEPGGLIKSFDTVADCLTYVGNDTGMMHVAGANDCDVLGLFFLENSIVKSSPWCSHNWLPEMGSGPQPQYCTACLAIDGVGRSVSVEEVFRTLQGIGV